MFHINLLPDIKLRNVFVLGVTVSSSDECLTVYVLLTVYFWAFLPFFVLFTQLGEDGLGEHAVLCPFSKKSLFAEKHEHLCT